MEFESIHAAQRYLRSYQSAIEAMLTHFDALRTVRGSGIKDASCCAVTLGSETVYGNSQAYKLDNRAWALGAGVHAEVVAYELGAQAGDAPRTLFCELSPCPRCRDHFAGIPGRIIYLFEYPGDLAEWKAFHNQPLQQQVAAVRRAALLL